MLDIINTIKSLDKLLKIKAAAPEQIAEAEKQLGVQFSKEYKAYLSEFGAILADGVELTGIAKSAHRNVVSVTVRERGLNKHVSDKLYVLESVGIDGIVVWQGTDGIVYQTTPNSQPIRLAESLAQFLVKFRKQYP